VLGAHPGVFKAAFRQVGVSDWVKAMEGASPMLKASDIIEYGNIDDPADRAFMASISPINNVAKIRTPLLVQHGANDPQDPVTESDRLVSGIRGAGGQVTYLRFADEGHGVVKTANRVHMYRRIAAFLEEKLGLTPAR
jgi:dipeptidyl aminopeptidase/acylaminoacyl peptidase